MFWTEDARTLFLGADSTATVAPRPEGGQMALKGPFWFDRDHTKYFDFDNDGVIDRVISFSSDDWSCKPDSTLYDGYYKCTTTWTSPSGNEYESWWVMPAEGPKGW